MIINYYKLGVPSLNVFSKTECESPFGFRKLENIIKV